MKKKSLDTGELLVGGGGAVSETLRSLDPRGRYEVRFIEETRTALLLFFIADEPVSAIHLTAIQASHLAGLLEQVSAGWQAGAPPAASAAVESTTIAPIAIDIIRVDVSTRGCHVRLSCYAPGVDSESSYQHVALPIKLADAIALSDKLGNGYVHAHLELVWRPYTPEEIAEDG